MPGIVTLDDIAETEKKRLETQAAIDSAKSLDARKRMGQFATPPALAREIAEYGVSLLPKGGVAFLEPSFGTGAFCSAVAFEAASRGLKIARAEGIEIDDEYFGAAELLWSARGVSLRKGDFTSTAPDAKYNFVLANPPYIRHHFIQKDDKSRLSESVRTETGISISGLAGIYCHFIILSRKWLAPGAVCGWLVPSEFMDVNYGVALKQFLLGKVRLLRIHRYDSCSSLFADALVSSCVVWFKNEIVDADYEIEFSFGGTHKEPKKSMMMMKSDLARERKWARFPCGGIRAKMDDSPTLGDFFTIKRGIATGDNSFFILPESRIKELGLGMEFFRPILPSPHSLKTDFVEADGDGFPKLDKRLFLLDCDMSEDEIKRRSPPLWRYIAGGADTAGRRFICKGRGRWWRQERRAASPFLCSYMGRGSNGRAPFRFVLNLSSAVATNSFLMLYPKEPLRAALSSGRINAHDVWEKLKKILASDLSSEGRAYGGGLKKIEPRELARVKCGSLA